MPKGDENVGYHSRDEAAAGILLNEKYVQVLLTLIVEGRIKE